jgi:hypothetical protein
MYTDEDKLLVTRLVESECEIRFNDDENKIIFTHRTKIDPTRIGPLEFPDSDPLNAEIHRVLSPHFDLKAAGVTGGMQFSPPDGGFAIAFFATRKTDRTL